LTVQYSVPYVVNFAYLLIVAHCNAMLEFRQTGCHREWWHPFTRVQITSKWKHVIILMTDHSTDCSLSSCRNIWMLVQHWRFSPNTTQE